MKRGCVGGGWVGRSEREERSLREKRGREKGGASSSHLYRERTRVTMR